MTPHLIDEILEMTSEQLDYDPEANWPVADQVSEGGFVNSSIQINGKRKAEIKIDSSATEDIIETEILKNETVKKYLGNEKPKRLIIVPKRIVNIVV